VAKYIKEKEEMTNSSNPNKEKRLSELRSKIIKDIKDNLKKELQVAVVEQK
jgi:hypothetical protein